MRRTEILIAGLILLVAAAGQAHARVGLPIALDQGTARVLLSVGAGFTPATAYLFRQDRGVCLALAVVSVLCLALLMLV